MFHIKKSNQNCTVNLKIRISTEVVKIEKFEYPAIIKYLYLKRFRRRKIYKDIFKIFDEQCAWYAEKIGFASAKRGKFSIKDEDLFLYPPQKIKLG